MSTKSNANDIRVLAQRIAEFGEPLRDTKILLFEDSDGWHYLERGADGLYHERPHLPADAPRWNNESFANLGKQASDNDDGGE